MFFASETSCAGRLVLVLALCAAIVGCNQRTHAVDNPMQHLRVLADDDMEGRGIGQKGLARALDYAESVFANAGLEPPFTGPDGRPSFRQEVAVAHWQFGDGTRAILSSGETRHEMRNGAEMLVFRPGSGTSRVAGEVVFVGYGIHEPELGRDDYAGIDARGKWAVLLEGQPEHMSPELEALYGNADLSGERMLAAAESLGVAGFIVVFQEQAYESWDVLSASYGNGVHTATRRYVGGLQADTSFPIVALGERETAAMFVGTGCDPIAQVGTERSFVLNDVRLELEIEAERSIIVSHNLAGVIRGQEAPDEIVTLSAHIDHLGIVDGQIHNGANDDASGCAVVLAAAARLMRSTSRRSVMCVLFTGEETGHFGSLQFMAEPPPGNIIAGLNLEHVGRSRDGTFLATVSPEFFPKIDAIAAAHRELRAAELDHEGAVVRGSDSYSYFLYGVPVVIIGGGGFPEYHGPDDDIGLIDPKMLNQALDLSLEVIAELVEERTE